MFLFLFVDFLSLVEGLFNMKKGAERIFAIHFVLYLVDSYISCGIVFQEIVL